MSDYHRKQEETGEHIWLRYATQFTAAGRSHTIEMSVPLPVGASDETREQLLHEAEKGLSHLISHVETRIPQILLQHAQAHSVHPAPASPAPASKPLVSHPVVKPASVPAPPTANQSPATNSQVREQKKELTREEEHGGEISQHSNGVSMPSLPGSGNGNLSIPEFIQAIKGLGLNPRQAMNLLKVKSLATGLNLREALDRLQFLIAQEAGETPATASQARESQPPATNSPVHNTASDEHANSDPADEEEPYENASIPIFDEEIGPEEEDFAEPLDDFSPSLTPSSRSRARAIVDKLHEARGATVVSPGRLQALHNVIGDQLSEEQLLTITHRLWGISILKRLKVDQVEALIYWAKEDDFLNEAEAVLALLEEEG